MSEMSIAEAKARFAQLVQRAEHGQAVRITRRGRPVAVLVSEADYARLSNRSPGLLAYSQAWRAQVAQAGVAPFSDNDLQGLRDQSDRPPMDLG